MSTSASPPLKQPFLTRIAVVAVLAGALLLALFELRHTFSTFILAFVLSYLFDPFVVWLERRRLPRMYCILILYGILGIISLFCVAYLLPFITIRWHGLLHDLPQYAQKVKGLITSLKGRWEPLFAGEELDWLADKGTEWLEKAVNKAGALMYASASTVAFNIFTILVSPILVFFMLSYKDSILKGLANLLPVKHRDAILSAGREIDRSMTGFIQGQLLVSVIVALLSSVALFVLDVDYPLLNGIFAGFASILPFIGVVLAMIPALFFAFVKFQNVAILLKVTGCFAVIYFLEGYVIKPLVFKESMDLNPLVTILMVMALGELIGFWGIILAIPLATAMRTFMVHIREGRFADE